MSRPSAAVARQRAGRPAHQRGILHDPSETQQPIAYETLLNRAPVVKTRRFSTACYGQARVKPAFAVWMNVMSLTHARLGSQPSQMV